MTFLVSLRDRMLRVGRTLLLMAWSGHWSSVVCCSNSMCPICVPNVLANLVEESTTLDKVVVKFTLCYSYR